MAGNLLDFNGSRSYGDSVKYDVHKSVSNGSLNGVMSGLSPEGVGMDNYTMQGPGKTPLYGQAIIIIMYSTITVLAVGGNLIVCYIVLAYQRMRTVTNIFIFNLAFSDILMSVLCIPFTFIANALVLYWPFPDLMCPFVTYVQALAVFLSAFTLVAISLDRYRAIIFPLWPRMTKQQAFVIIIVIWLLSLAVPLPIAILSKTHPIGNITDKSLCLEEWPNPDQRYTYSLVIMILQYFLPLFVLMFTYLKIALVIWGKKAPGEAENNRDQRMAASKRKMVKMMIIVVIIYGICWLPLHTITLIGDSYEEIYSFPYIYVIWTACHWLAMSNSCYNPIVYCWMNTRYRNGFRYALRFCPGITYDADQHSPERFQRLHTYVTTMRSSTATDRVKSSRNSSTTPDSPYSQRHRKSSNFSTTEQISLDTLENGYSNKKGYDGYGQGQIRNKNKCYGPKDDDDTSM